MTAVRRTYHHGNLRDALVEEATRMIKVDGIDGLSMRKLADIVGVSRTALYHHFTDKNALLCAIAETGFSRWHEEAERIVSQTGCSEKEKVCQFVHDYIQYAADNPELYELMFGRTIWKNATPTEQLKNAAYPSFQHQVSMTRRWQSIGLMPKNEDTLRLAQVFWGTLHGIARLLIDGIYADKSHIDDMCLCAIHLFCVSENTEIE